MYELNRTPSVISVVSVVIVSLTYTVKCYGLALAKKGLFARRGDGLSVRHRSRRNGLSSTSADKTILCRKSRSNLHRRTSLQPRLK